MRSYLQRVKSHKVSEPSFALSEAQYPTLGPKHAFGAILFVEKEGFEPLFRAAQIAERFDVAIMSTKGMSARAARQLIDELHRFNVPVFVLHDCDKHGFSIFGTLGRDSIRYKFRHLDKQTSLTHTRVLSPLLSGRYPRRYPGEVLGEPKCAKSFIGAPEKISNS